VAYAPQDEKHPARARSPYGAAKIAARQIVKVYRESYKLYAVQGLLFNHESERRGEEFVTRKISLGVARIARAMKDNKPFDPIELGNLDSKRDWSHAEDFVEGIWRMLNQNEYRNDIDPTTKWTIPNLHLQEYILASGETHTIRTFVEKAFYAANIDGSWSGKGTDEAYHSLWGYTPEGVIKLVRINPAFYRPAEVELLLGDSTRARAELGWSPKVSFDDLVTRMVKNDLKEAGL
jgi:GDPmannose 4,6-dehydratase